MPLRTLSMLLGVTVLAGCHLLSPHKACFSDEDCPDSACDLEFGVCEDGGEGEGE